MHSIANNWKSIETISIIGFSFFTWPESEDGLLAGCHHLRSLHIRPCSFSIPDNLLVDLPPTLRSLSILHKQGADFIGGLQPIMAGLKEFHLIEPDDDHGRGARSDLIANLRDVRHLTIGPWTVADLAAELGSLQHLTELAIAFRDEDDFVPACDVVAFISRASALRKLAISSQIRSHWSEDELHTIKAAALEHDVELGNADYAWKMGPGKWDKISSYDGQGW